MNPKQININELNYDLPFNKIANKPLTNREDSKLLIYSKNKITDEQFINAHNYLPKNSTLIFNNTKVVQARLIFKNSNGAKIELFCLEPFGNTVDVGNAMGQTNSSEWLCLIGNLKKWKNNTLELSNQNIKLIATKGQFINEKVIVKFNWEPNHLSFAEILNTFGNIPIPPYFKRESELIDSERYQTLYAKAEGSVAAPTAGLHFTENSFLQFQKNNINVNYVTLHVGAGTFMPVKSEFLENHLMHAEWIDVDLDLICSLQKESFIIAVGTTSLRTLESLYWMGLKISKNNIITLSQLELKQWEVYELTSTINYKESFKYLENWLIQNSLTKLICKTSILIAPPYKLKVAKALFTNFHQPQSTLLALVYSIVGSNWKLIYNYALQNNYRFLSYGDSSLLFLED
ncbi:MAG: S-adenosylmethionine:tRNA ribosyltransferase-isomerase [Bacteroidetes bacterium]|nr:S-adenosylmethionine:tRNA ribosyltransferase-isomerase [Bacteroidota bacterium]